MSSFSADVAARIAQLWVYPVKSCAGVAVTEAVLTDCGLDLDRAWMVVDEHGDAVTQRELPRLALVRPQLKLHEVVLRAPGMLALHLQIDAVEAPVSVRMWDEPLAAYDMGGVAAQWFSDFLGARLRLARFDPEQRRVADTAWTGGIEATSQFSDGFPLLVLGEASLVGLNDRLAAAGQAAAEVQRFRPNIVLNGIEAHDEDRVATLEIDADDGTARLQLVKPCPRCPIPNVDPATAAIDTRVSDALQRYRQSDRLGGAIAFGMNAIVTEGDGLTLKVGQPVRGSLVFD
jgi:uncharacterized protein YcbX